MKTYRPDYAQRPRRDEVTVAKSNETGTVIFDSVVFLPFIFLKGYVCFDSIEDS